MKPTRISTGEHKFDWDRKYKNGQENLLKKEVKRFLDVCGVKWFMPVPTGYSPGAVDFLCCARGMFLAIETKAGDNDPTKRQWDFLIETMQAGGSAVLAYTLGEVEEAIRAIYFGEQFISKPIEERYLKENAEAQRKG